jgi:hypothetical protein
MYVHIITPEAPPVHYIKSSHLPKHFFSELFGIADSLTNEQGYLQASQVFYCKALVFFSYGG